LQRRLKLEEEQLGPLTQLVDEFNRGMDEIASLYAEIFQERNKDFDNSVQVAMSRRDPSQMEGFKARTREILPPIAQEVQTKEQDLTSGLQEILDDSQYDKWLKYQQRNRPNSQFN
jgi:DNA anti-recombination protein RmuC